MVDTRFNLKDYYNNITGYGKQDAGVLESGVSGFKRGVVGLASDVVGVADPVLGQAMDAEVQQTTRVGESGPAQAAAFVGQVGASILPNIPAAATVGLARAISVGGAAAVYGLSGAGGMNKRLTEYERTTGMRLPTQTKQMAMVGAAVVESGLESIGLTKSLQAVKKFSAAKLSATTAAQLGAAAEQVVTGKKPPSFFATLLRNALVVEGPQEAAEAFSTDTIAAIAAEGLAAYTGALERYAMDYAGGALGSTAITGVAALTERRRRNQAVEAFRAEILQKEYEQAGAASQAGTQPAVTPPAPATATAVAQPEGIRELLTNARGGMVGASALQTLLGTPDYATATRYADQLVARGVLTKAAGGIYHVADISKLDDGVEQPPQQLAPEDSAAVAAITSESRNAPRDYSTMTTEELARLAIEENAQQGPQLPATEAQQDAYEPPTLGAVQPRVPTTAEEALQQRIMQEDADIRASIMRKIIGRSTLGRALTAKDFQFITQMTTDELASAEAFQAALLSRFKDYTENKGFKSLYKAAAEQAAADLTAAGINPATYGLDKGDMQAIANGLQKLAGEDLSWADRRELAATLDLFNEAYKQHLDKANITGERSEQAKLYAQLAVETLAKIAIKAKKRSEAPSRPQQQPSQQAVSETNTGGKRKMRSKAKAPAVETEAAVEPAVEPAAQPVEQEQPTPPTSPTQPAAKTTAKKTSKKGLGSKKKDEATTEPAATPPTEQLQDPAIQKEIEAQLNALEEVAAKYANLLRPAQPFEAVERVFRILALDYGYYKSDLRRVIAEIATEGATVESMLAKALAHLNSTVRSGRPSQVVRDPVRQAQVERMVRELLGNPQQPQSPETQGSADPVVQQTAEAALNGQATAEELEQVRKLSEDEEIENDDRQPIPDTLDDAEQYRQAAIEAASRAAEEEAERRVIVESIIAGNTIPIRDADFAGILRKALMQYPVKALKILKRNNLSILTTAQAKSQRAQEGLDEAIHLTIARATTATNPTAYQQALNTIVNAVGTAHAAVIMKEQIEKTLNDRDFGGVCFSSSLIVVKSPIPKTPAARNRFEQTLVHELLHAIIDGANYDPQMMYKAIAPWVDDKVKDVLSYENGLDISTLERVVDEILQRSKTIRDVVANLGYHGDYLPRNDIEGLDANTRDRYIRDYNIVKLYMLAQRLRSTQAGDISPLVVSTPVERIEAFYQESLAYACGDPALRVLVLNLLGVMPERATESNPLIHLANPVPDALAHNMAHTVTPVVRRIVEKVFRYGTIHDIVVTEGQEFAAAISFENGKRVLKITAPTFATAINAFSNVARYVNPETKNISPDRLITETYKHMPQLVEGSGIDGRYKLITPDILVAILNGDPPQQIEQAMAELFAFETDQPPRNRYKLTRGDFNPAVNAFYDSIAERALQAGKHQEAGLAKELETLFKDGKRVQKLLDRILGNERVLESELRAAAILMNISKPRLEQELALATTEEERAAVRASYEKIILADDMVRNRWARLGHSLNNIPTSHAEMKVIVKQRLGELTKKHESEIEALDMADTMSVLAWLNSHSVPEMKDLVSNIIINGWLFPKAIYNNLIFNNIRAFYEFGHSFNKVLVDSVLDRIGLSDKILDKNMQSYYAGAVWEGTKAQLEGSKGALSTGWKILMGDTTAADRWNADVGQLVYSVWDMFKYRYKEGSKRRAIAEKLMPSLGSVMNISMRSMAATDVVFRAGFINKHLVERAWHAAHNLGYVEGSPTFKSFVEDFVAEPPAEILNEAKAVAADMLLIGKAGEILNAAKGIRGLANDVGGTVAIPLGTITMPFLHTFAKSIDFAFQFLPVVGAYKRPMMYRRGIRDAFRKNLGYKTPAAQKHAMEFARKHGAPSLPDIIAKQLEGALIAALLLWLFDTDKFTLGLPKDAKEREMFYATGRIPWAYQAAPRNWVALDRIEPFGTVFKAGLSLHKMIDDINKTPEDMTTAFYDFSRNLHGAFTDSSFLDGIGKMLSPYEQKRTLVTFPSTLVPYSNFWRSINNSLDYWQNGYVSVKSRPTTILAGMAHELYYTMPPLLRDMLPTAALQIGKDAPSKLDAWGEPIELQKDLYNIWMPIRWQQAVGDSVDEELYRIGASPVMPSTSFQLNNKEYEYDLQAYQKMAGAYGKEGKRRLANLFKRPSYKQASDELKLKLIGKTLTGVGKVARARAQADTLRLLR